MSDSSGPVQRTYLVLTVLTTLAASSIWGVNTLFLLDAGLDNTQAFAANAAFTLGMVLFEIPTGVVADTSGRRFSFLLGTVVLLASTLLYWWMWMVRAPFAGWLLASLLVGLGFTFFSGATEAWLVDALAATGHTGDLERVFGRAQVASGAALLTGSLAGGLIAQVSNLGVPYLVRSGLLAVTAVVAAATMHDLGFTPDRGRSPTQALRVVLAGSIDGGLRNPPVRWLMLAAPFTAGVGIYVFYALQPYLLQLAGDPRAYAIAGAAAALSAGAQICGGLLVGVLLLVGLAAANSLWIALVLIGVWSLVGAATSPLRQSFLNGLIPSAQRATVLSFDSLMGSSGGVVVQPVLGRVADVSGYAASYLVASGVYALALPFTWLARRERASSDPIDSADA